MDKIDEQNIDTRLRDLNGNILKVGIDPSEGIIGPDDAPQYGQKLTHYKIRTDDTYPRVPKEAKEAEISFVLPMANFLAHHLGIDIIDEVMYNCTLKQLRQRMLFVVMNMYNLKIHDGVAAWDGIILTCKTHPIVFIRFKMQVSTKKIGIAFVKTWDSARQVYVAHGDSEQNRFMAREDATTLTLNYLNVEGVVKI